MNVNAIVSFRAAVHALLSAPAKSTSKAIQLRNWFSENFSTEARVAQITEDRQIGMRLTEQFDHRLPIVTFVCSSDINFETLEKRIRAKVYPELQAVLVVSVSNRRKIAYEHLYARVDTPFTDWVKQEMHLNREDFVVQQRQPSLATSDGTKVFQTNSFSESILAAIRTKPFILLAGISGTGKSRMVRQLARGCCPRYKDGSTTDDHPLYNEQKSGNFESIAVRPNWHDSTELMGYVTRITADDQPKFVLTPFVKFLAKAWQNLDVPFFLCMDEMNLAPVEQYFAEYLSVIESRDWIDASDHSKGLQTDVMVRFDVAQIKKDASHPYDDETKNFVEQTVRELLPDYASAAEGSDLKKLGDRIIADNGLRIPPNLVVMGTVNMDETTCSFSRKVLDRAMTFELNDVSDMYDPANIAGEGPIAFNSIGPNGVSQTLLTGRDACAEDAAKAKTVLDYIKSINDSLENTPFKIAYRSRNEIMVYCFERTRDGVVGLAQALDEATSMKILSRIEGDDQKLRDPSTGNEATSRTLLDVLGEKIPVALKVANGGNELTPPCTVCKDKIEFMKRRLDGGFTNFFV